MYDASAKKSEAAVKEQRPKDKGVAVTKPDIRGTKS
jgi:hypothetical protein